MKRCTLCQAKKPLEEYNRNKAKKDGLQDVCRECNRNNARQYYAKNKVKHRQTVRQYKLKQIKRNQERIYALLARASCVDCQSTHFLSLEFDHRENKRANVSKLVTNGYSWNTIKQEIKKCDIRCRLCHTVKTHEEQNSARWKYWQRLNGFIAQPGRATDF